MLSLRMGKSTVRFALEMMLKDGELGDHSPSHFAETMSQPASSRNPLLLTKRVVKKDKISRIRKNDSKLEPIFHIRLRSACLEPSSYRGSRGHRE